MCELDRRMQDVEQKTSLFQVVPEAIKEVQRVVLEVNVREDDEAEKLKVRALERRMAKLEERFYDADELEVLFDRLDHAVKDKKSAAFWFERRLASTVNKIIKALSDRHDIFVERWTIVNALLNNKEVKEFIQDTVHDKVAALVADPAMGESILDTLKETVPDWLSCVTPKGYVYELKYLKKEEEEEEESVECSSSSGEDLEEELILTDAGEDGCSSEEEEDRKEVVLDKVLQQAVSSNLSHSVIANIVELVLERPLMDECKCDEEDEYEWENV